MLITYMQVIQPVKYLFKRLNNYKTQTNSRLSKDEYTSLQASRLIKFSSLFRTIVCVAFKLQQRRSIQCKNHLFRELISPKHLTKSLSFLLEFQLEFHACPYNTVCPFVS